MINREEILTAAQSYNIITFDVFDTLIIRDVEKPSDVFRHCYGFSGKYSRIIAEESARKKTERGEITLREIEDCFRKKCDKEIEFEKKICRANPEMLEVYNELRGMGKTVYAISDMYLDAKVISDILTNEGYHPDGVIVSSEFGCSKKNGDLFRHFMKEYQYHEEEILHIGDNRESDYEGAGKAGIKAILVPKHKDCLKYRRFSYRTDELDSFINHGLNGIEDSMQRIGYEVVGPMVLSFCQWVHKKCMENNFERLYFLARDMHFTFDIYNRIYRDDTHYLCVSRKSLRNARNNPEEFLLYLKDEGVYGNVAVVDTGWVGTAQVEIEKYAKQIDESTDLGGLYLGTNVAFRIRKRSKRSFACIYSSFAEQLNCELSSAFLEVLIGSQERQVISYQNGKPVFNNDSLDDFHSAVKTGAEQFILDWVEKKDNKEIDPKDTKKPFERLFRNPHADDIEKMGNLQCDDIEVSKIITYGGKEKYKGNRSAWLHDLSLSPWKGGFFQKSFKHYRFLLGIYLAANTVRNALIDVKHIKRDRLE